MPSRTQLRFPLLALGMVALLAGLWGGLVRLGWSLPVLQPLLTLHGPLIVAGFVGTVISLERAVALGSLWAYAAPLLTGLGALILIVGLPSFAGALLTTLGSVGLAVILMIIFAREVAFHTVILILGALTYLVGNSLWLAGWPMHTVVVWWIGFLVLTIAGERLELARLLRLSKLSRSVFVVSVALLLGGLIWVSVDLNVGVRIVGGGMVALALWLLSHDIALRTVKQSGLPRFIAICLLVGYVWLGVSGILAFTFGEVITGPRYDAVLHAFFMGFVFSMIFGHAPIIFPAILGRAVAFRSTFYAHVALLHVSLLLRITGDLLDWFPGRQWGGLLNVLALLLFFANTGGAAFVSTRRTHS